jgi:hypothetical protein
LTLSWNAFAKNGSGDLILSDSVIYNLERYLKYRNPVIFLVTQDGANSSAWKCDSSNCVATGSMNETSLCERKYGKKCSTFAIRRTIKWQNDLTRDVKGKEKRFNSKDSLTEIKTKLTALGFYESSGVERNKETNERVKKNRKQRIEGTSKKTKAQKDVNTEDILPQLQKIIKLYNSGKLTEKEFTEAKEEILN